MTLEFDGIQFSYDSKPLLSGIYVKCETGKITGLLGRNGSGKSTLLKIAFGSIQPEVISFRIDQRSVSHPAFTSKQISYLPQSDFIPHDLPLEKILKLYHVDRDHILNDFPEMQNDFTLQARELSGGRLRLFEVLLVLSMNTPFCFLDEPFTGLTPALVERLQSVLQNKKKQKGILITDHLYRQVMSLADDLYLLTNGKTYKVKEVEDLVRRGYLLE
jgi:ABC-type multidrug transport system ATPase subunit